jgi:hypothetical protein
MENAAEMDKFIDQMMGSLGFTEEDNDRLVASYSGGWKMRMSLGKILLQVRPLPSLSTSSQLQSAIAADHQPLLLARTHCAAWRGSGSLAKPVSTQAAPPPPPPRYARAHEAGEGPGAGNVGAGPVAAG